LPRTEVAYKKKDFCSKTKVVTASVSQLAEIAQLSDVNVLVIDIGGNNVKILASRQSAPRKFPSGPTMTPKQMVAGVKKLAGDWKYDVVSIG
jgi:hypothetical protein